MGINCIDDSALHSLCCLPKMAAVHLNLSKLRTKYYRSLNFCPKHILTEWRKQLFLSLPMYELAALPKLTSSRPITVMLQLSLLQRIKDILLAE